jgi:hypothetical protein
LAPYSGANALDRMLQLVIALLQQKIHIFTSAQF